LSMIVAVANQKGGVGKTTTAVNISACIAALGCRVLLVDMDPQGNSTSGYGVDKPAVEYTSYDLLLSDVSVQQATLETMLPTLKLVPADVELAGAEVELVSAIAREHILKAKLDAVRDLYDYIFIDCPPSLGLLTLNALTAADRLLVPIQCEFYALEGLSQLVSTASQVKKHLNPGLKVEGVVLTMYDARTNLSMQVAQEVKRHFQEKVYRTMIPRNVRLSEAPSHGLPVMLYDPLCSGTEAYKQLAKEFVAHTQGGN